MGRTCLSEEDCDGLRQKPILGTRHVVKLKGRLLWMAEKILFDGKIYRIGNDKYRAIYHDRNKTLFHIFKDVGDHLEIITTGETTRGKDKWD